MVEDAYAACERLIVKAKKGLLENKPGCDQEQTLEAEISKVLSDVRGNVGEICMKELSRHNAPLIMATCGSKGASNSFNIQILLTINRFRHQRVTDGCLCRTADYCRASSARRFSGPVITALP